MMRASPAQVGTVTPEGLPSKQAMSFEEATMRIDVLVVPDCPNGPVVIERLAQALAGRADVQVETRVIDTVEQAEQWGMHGSPTVLVDGRDPFAAPGTPASVSCRLYPGEGGRAQGAPSLARLCQALDGQEERCAHESAAAAPFGVPAGQVLAELAAEDFLTLDADGRISAAYPFSAAPTGVQVEPSIPAVCLTCDRYVPNPIDATALLCDSP
jgi:hypothetical protein